MSNSHFQVVHNLSYMTVESKKRVLREIGALQPQDYTNLWHGLKEGIQLLKNAASAPENVPAIYVLTDGNFICF